MARWVLATGLGASCLWASAEAADFLQALSDVSLGANLLEDVSDTLVSAAEIPSLFDVGEALAAMVGFDAEQLQNLPQNLPQLAEEQRKQLGAAEQLFLSPLSTPLSEARHLPQSPAAQPQRDVEASTSTNPSSEGNSNKSSRGPMVSLPVGLLPFTIRSNYYNLDPLEFERLAETVAESVANSSMFGVRSKDALTALAHLNPFYVMQLQQQLQRKNDLEQQIRKENELQEALKVKAQKEAQKAQQQQMQQQMQQQLAEQQQEKVQRQNPSPSEGGEGEAPQPAAAAAAPDAAQGDSQQPASAAAPLEASAAGEESVSAAASPASTTEGASPAAAAAAGEAEKKGEGEDSEEDEQQARFRAWSRTNPFGPVQHISDLMYLMNWSVKNPLAILEWKSYAYNQCMAALNDESACLKALKVEPGAVNHGGTNSPWRPSSSP